MSYNETVGVKLRLCLHRFLLFILLPAALVSCLPRHNDSIQLVSFSENDVDVTIELARQPGGKFSLTATFTPPDGYHLYSKDIPAMGVEGLGRPTLLELAPRSHLMAAGPLTESVKAQIPDFGPRELFVYPSGPVTLSLPVELPSGREWIEDKVQVTYMACSSVKCKPPVEGKVIPVRIPGEDTADPK